MGQSAIFEKWSSLSTTYTSIWPKLNDPFFRCTIPSLPRIPAEGILNVPGVGPGIELAIVRQKYPNCLIQASDPAKGMVDCTRERIEAEGLSDVSVEERDIFDLQEESAYASLSLFVIHLVRKPVEAFLSQYASIQKGGWAAAVYFPPVPEGDGPLAALYNAARILRPKDPPEWETTLHDRLEQTGVARIQTEALHTEWNFDHRSDFRKAMEQLPHFLAVRSHVGEELYESMWDIWEKESGLRELDGKWVGPAVANKIIAFKE